MILVNFNQKLYLGVSLRVALSVHSFASMRASAKANHYNR
jgi:hypothetical protein